ncbi:MAG: fimbria/pilus outer membrane usher protein [Gammaproteobacteria bacterium]
MLLSAAASAAEYEMLILEVAANGGPARSGFVLTDDSGRYWVEEAMVDEWRVNGDRPQAVVHRGLRYLPLAGFQGSTADFDPTRLSLDVSIPPRFLRAQQFTGSWRSGTAPASDVGIYSDYNLSYQKYADGDSKQFVGFIEPIAFSPVGTLRNSLIYRQGEYGDDGFEDFDDDDGWVRLETTWEKDNPDLMQSYRVGDGMLYPGMLGSPTRFAGVQVATNFNTQPYFITFPLPSLDGETALASEAELFVNGRLAQRQELTPGPFNFDNIRVNTGAGEARLVTRDLLGREQVVVTDFYASQVLLTAGLSDYSYSVGTLRKDYGFDSNDYRDVFFAGFHRHGLNDTVTVEGNSELAADFRRIGSGVTFSRLRLGVTSLGLTVSDGDDPGTGASWMVGHGYRSNLFNLAVNYRGYSSNYRELSFVEDTDQPKARYTMTGGLNLARRGTISGSFLHQQNRGTANLDLFTVNYSKVVARRLFLSASSSYVENGDDSDFAFTLSANLSLGNQRSASFGLQTRDGDTRATAQLQQNLPTGPGYGYRFGTATGSGNTEWDADVSAQTRTGRYSLESTRTDDGTSWRASTAGSAAWVGGMPFMAREVRDAFAVVQVNGFENVRVMLENQEIGRTDGSGRVLVPGLRPYQNNKISIKQEDLPLTANIESVAMNVTPYFRTGVLADFPAREGRDVLLRLLLPDGSPAPEGSVVRAVETDEFFPVGLDGQVYLRDVGDGAALTLSWRDNACGFDLRIQDTDRLVPDLGDVMCAGENGR